MHLPKVPNLVVHFEDTCLLEFLVLLSGCSVSIMGLTTATTYHAKNVFALSEIKYWNIFTAYLYQKL